MNSTMNMNFVLSHLMVPCVVFMLNVARFKQEQQKPGVFRISVNNRALFAVTKTHINDKLKLQMI